MKGSLSNGRGFNERYYFQKCLFSILIASHLALVVSAVPRSLPPKFRLKGKPFPKNYCMQIGNLANKAFVTSKITQDIVRSAWMSTCSRTKNVKEWRQQNTHERRSVRCAQSSHDENIFKSIDEAQGKRLCDKAMYKVFTYIIPSTKAHMTTTVTIWFLTAGRRHQEMRDSFVGSVYIVSRKKSRVEMLESARKKLNKYKDHPMVKAGSVDALILPRGDSRFLVIFLFSKKYMAEIRKMEE